MGFWFENGCESILGIFNAGSCGVDLFFVLSGFIIVHVHGTDIGHPGRIFNYAFNRIVRIYPALWIMTVVAVITYASGFGGAEKASKLDIYNIAASFFLLPQENARAGSALVNVSWTLKYELFFYIMFAILILHKRVGVAIFCVWQVAVLAATSWSRQEDVLGLKGFYLNSMCLEFSIGLACARLIEWPVFTKAFGGVAAPLLLLLAGSLAFVGGMEAELLTRYAGILYALGAGAIILGLVCLEGAGRIRAPDILLVVGNASYSIYLVHFSVINILAIVLIRTKLFELNNFTYLLVAISGVLSGIVFHKLIDRPIQKLLRRKLKPALTLGKRRFSSLVHNAL